MEFLKCDNIVIGRVEVNPPSCTTGNSSRLYVCVMSCICPDSVHICALEQQCVRKRMQLSREGGQASSVPFYM